ncbi:unnamed protein product [Ambrosiozyma monospora]|uniref:Unnamed protein product n=1 Tax=Ambrosiozyma monospora TaxID=43982 RepID=A0ACB5TYN4_AMBMO|nr:unnamed protein product [Ambrosiozyma monospora]
MLPIIGLIRSPITHLSPKQITVGSLITFQKIPITNSFHRNISTVLQHNNNINRRGYQLPQKNGVLFHLIAKNPNLCNGPSFNIHPRGQVRNAAFWKVGTNVRLFRQMLKDSGNSQLKFRLLVFIGLFIILNFLFNVLMAILTNLYLDQLQPTSGNFGLWVNSQFKTGVVDEEVKANISSANEKYDECLRYIAKDNGLIDDPNNPQRDYLLGVKELDHWFYEKNDVNYISCYIDLLLRYALTLNGNNASKALSIINNVNALVQYYEELAHQQIGTYTLKNKGLRTVADILKEIDADFSDIEEILKASIYLLEVNEFKNKPAHDSDYAQRNQNI